MVGNKVDDDLQSVSMTALKQLLELRHTLVYILRQVWIGVVIVGYGIRRACLSFHDCRMLARNAIRGVVCRCGVTDDSRIPYMGVSLASDLF